MGAIWSLLFLYFFDLYGFLFTKDSTNLASFTSLRLDRNGASIFGFQDIIRAGFHTDLATDAFGFIHDKSIPAFGLIGIPFFIFCLFA